MIKLLHHKKLKIGDLAPNFKLLNRENKVVTLSNFNQKYKILSIFPAINTKVCNLQTATLFKTITNNDHVVVLNISKDTVAVQNEWCLAKQFKDIQTLSASEDHNFGNDYGVNFLTKKIFQRAVLILDKDNKVIYTNYVKNFINPIDFDMLNKKLKTLNLI